MRRAILAAGIGLTLTSLVAQPVSAQTDRPQAQDARPDVVEGNRPADPTPLPDPRAEERNVEALTLACKQRADLNVVGCEWRPATSERAAGYQLWRLVDRGHREMVWRGGLDQTNAADRVPEDAAVARYVVLAVDSNGKIVGRSRVAVVKLASGPTDVRPTDRPVTDVRPVDTRPTDRPVTDVRPSDRRIGDRPDLLSLTDQRRIRLAFAGGDHNFI